MIRTILFLLYSFTLAFAGNAQNDTLVVEDEPIVIHKKVYFAPEPQTVKKDVKLGVGFSDVGAYRNYSDDLRASSMIRNVQLTGQYQLRKKHLLGSVGVTVQMLDFKKEYDETVTEYEENKIVVRDTTTTFEVNLVEDEYYPEGRLDTTWFVFILERDSNYTVSKKREVEAVKSVKRTMLQVPFSVGYSFQVSRFLIDIETQAIPTLLIADRTVFFKSTVGASMSVYYQVTPKVSVGPSGYLQWSMNFAENTDVDLHSQSSRLQGLAVNVLCHF